MEAESTWSDQISEKIDEQKGNLSEKDFKRYRLGVLVRVAKRVETFAGDCAECDGLKSHIAKLAEGIPNLADASKEERKSHRKGVQAIVAHLLKRHKLTYEGEHTGSGLALGLVFGAGIGAAMKNVGIGIPVGMCLGLALGAAREADAKKKGNMI
ncbi:MAG: hypothetical protein ACYS8Z_18715 [Planctomycetota bacterium]